MQNIESQLRYLCTLSYNFATQSLYQQRASAPAAHLSLGASKRSSQSNLFIRIWYFLASFKQFKTFLQQNLFRSFQVYRSSFVCCFNKECNSIQYGKVIISLRHFREKFSYTLSAHLCDHLQQRARSWRWPADSWTPRRLLGSRLKNIEGNSFWKCIEGVWVYWYKEFLNLPWQKSGLLVIPLNFFLNLNKF